MTRMTREEVINHLEDLQVFKHEPTVMDIIAIGMAIEYLREPEQIRWIRHHADSTLDRMTKTELIEYVRICEKNTENAMQTVDQQARNVEMLLKEAERPKGQWIVVGKTWSGANTLKCSHCGKTRRGSMKSAFCRDCGADMRGEQE